MNKYFQKLISVLLVIVVLVNVNVNTFAGTTSNSGINNKRISYVNGVQYHVSIDKSLNITVETIGLKKNAKMVIDKNGEGFIKGLTEQKYNEQYEVIIQNLQQEDVDVKIIKGNDKSIGRNGGQQVERIRKKDLISDRYEGQISIGVGGGIVVAGWLVNALLASGAAIILFGSTWYAVDAIMEQRTYGYYYPAVMAIGQVFISPNSITRSDAVRRVSNNDDVYTYFSTSARSIVVDTRYGVVGPENHWSWAKIGVFYDHFHPNITYKNRAHVWFGVPQRRSL